MIDLAALPLWMEVLITDYGLGPQRSGALVSMFLLAAVASCLFFAPRFGRVGGAKATFAGYMLGAIAFAVSANTTTFILLCASYLVGGAAVGCALSVTHGTIGRSANAHRLFATAGAAFGFFAIGFFSVAPYLTARFGGGALFWLFAAVMAVAALLCVVAFPRPVPGSAMLDRHREPLESRVWLAIFGVSGMALTQALIASFLQRIGLERGFGVEHVNTVLLVGAVLTLFPAPLAGWLQGRLSTRTVVIGGPAVQVALALAITQGTPFWTYALAGSLLTSTQIFVHTFAFGLIARTDGTGRATAATPAMLMTGSALGPFLAGSLASGLGHPTLGYCAVGIGFVAMVCFHRSTRVGGHSLGRSVPSTIQDS